jgi:hypothetical protein
LKNQNNSYNKNDPFNILVILISHALFSWEIFDIGHQAIDGTWQVEQTTEKKSAVLFIYLLFYLFIPRIMALKVTVFCIF